MTGCDPERSNDSTDHEILECMSYLQTSDPRMFVDISALSKLEPLKDIFDHMETTWGAALALGRAGAVVGKPGDKILFRS
jgi:hypothetical protein